MLRALQWFAGFVLIVLTGIIAFAAYTGDAEIVRLLITAIASFAGGGAAGRATKTTEKD